MATQVITQIIPEIKLQYKKGLLWLKYYGALPPPPHTTHLFQWLEEHILVYVRQTQSTAMKIPFHP